MKKNKHKKIFRHHNKEVSISASDSSYKSSSEEEED
jgi:hypothetical protein